MEGLAKSVEVSSSISNPSAPNISTGQAPVEAWAGVPLQVYRFLGIDFAQADPKTMEEVATVFKYIDQDLDKRTTGRVLEKLSEIELRLGAPKLGETRHGRICDYLRMNEVIKDVRRQQRAIVNAAR